jgi:spore coat protein U-like protein
MSARSNHLHAIIGVTAAIAGLSLSSLPASASTATTTFSVSATVQSTCMISASNLAFGNYSGSLINMTTTLSVTCSNSTTYNVGLNAGTASGRQ